MTTQNKVISAIISMGSRVKAVPSAILQTVPLGTLASHTSFKVLSPSEQKQMLNDVASALNTTALNTTAVWKQFLASKPSNYTLKEWCTGTELLRCTTPAQILGIADDPRYASELLCLLFPDLIAGVLSAEDTRFDLFSSQTTVQATLGSCLAVLGPQTTLDQLAALAIKAGKCPTFEALIDLPDPEYFISKLLGSLSIAASVLNVLKDHPLALIKWGFISTYAELLATGGISPLHPTFIPFLEECGSLRMPMAKDIIFTIGVSSAKEFDPKDVLLLAPTSAFLRSALNRGLVNVMPHCDDNVTVSIRMTEPHDCDRIEGQCAAKVKLDVLFEDRVMLVINKQPGLPTEQHRLCHVTPHASCRGDVVTSLLRYLPSQRNVKNCGIVHRLDSDTSGVMVIAKSDEAVRLLTPEVLSDKTYFAICRDLRAEQQPEKSVVRESYRNSAGTNIRSDTEYEVVRYYDNALVAVKAKIYHGKKHQIRRHLASKGLPICGDGKYGGCLSTMPCAQRVALHAASVTISHPTTKMLMTFTAPLPSDFRSMIIK